MDQKKSPCQLELDTAGNDSIREVIARNSFPRHKQPAISLVSEVA
jgi:hypothetical protein